MDRSLFLPTKPADLKALGWSQLDIILITGDAYVDHPSFGVAILGRYLESHGFKVGIIAQPDWQREADFKRLGKPRLCFGVTAGNMDSMINHYTARKKIRSEDAYSPAGKVGLRPNRATIIYTQKLKSIFKDVPVIIGGIEASLRRIPHYDYWSDKLRNSVLLDAKADLLIYGMAERSLLQVCRYLDEKININDLNDLPGTVSLVKEIDENQPHVTIKEFSKKYSVDDFYQMTKLFQISNQTKTVYMPFAGRFLRHNPPAEKLSEKEMNLLYDLPYQRTPHPDYKGNTIKAYEQIKTSVTSHRGCFGGCNFCAIGLHQGKAIQSRSEASIKNELQLISRTKGFGGTISDIGGPTANMYGMYCKKHIEATCPRNSCLYPDICPNLSTSHRDLKKLLKDVTKLRDIQHIFVASGIRFDLAILDGEYIDLLSANHTGGLVKLAPEHTEDSVLQHMNKPSFKKYENFYKRFKQASNKNKKKQFIVPYIIVGHPGARLEDTIAMAVYLKKHNIRLKQIQEFTPTPMTISTMMYYTGRDLQGRKINVPKGRDLRLQKALVQWFVPKNRKYIFEALSKAKRLDLKHFFS